MAELLDGRAAGGPRPPGAALVRPPRRCGRCTGPTRPFMLKLSLGARITNSVRVNLAKELARGVEVHRLLAAGLGAELAGRFPGFAIVRDPAWLTLRTGRDGPESGFEVVLRENPYREGDRTDASVVAGLCHPGPGGGPSRLADDRSRTWPRPPAGPPAAVASRVVPPLPGRGRRPAAVAVRRLGDRAGGPPAEQHRRAGRGLAGRVPLPGQPGLLLQGVGRRPAAAAGPRPEPGQRHRSATSAVADERFSYYLAVNHLFGDRRHPGTARRREPTRATCWPTWPATSAAKARDDEPGPARWWRPCWARPGCGSRPTCAPAWTTWTS